ncbi:MAG: CBS domain-containing protein [Candidatus Micrarchaeota archaeon]|nr:CBS domain-containing protein [Candidatus Micrarchaeota archaeon]
MRKGNGGKGPQKRGRAGFSKEKNTKRAKNGADAPMNRAAGARISDIMRSDFFYLDGEEKLDVVIGKFANYGIHEAPVLSKGELKGLLSDREIAEAMLEKSVLPWKDNKIMPMEKLRRLKASQIMKRKVLTLEPGMGLADAVKDMGSRDANVIPVVERGRVVGIVTGKDVIAYVAKNIVSHDLGEACWAGGMQSTVDSVLKIVNRGKAISSMEVAKELGMTTEKVEELARSLARHGLISIRYTIAGRMELKVLE